LIMRLLTKSRFKLALECPNKLFYTRKKEYANQKQEDEFLQALALLGDCPYYLHLSRS